MAIETAHQSIKTLFEQNPTFEVPKYQREYAWDAEEIEDFVEDLRKCLKARIAESKRNHFFGGIVSARLTVPGSSHVSYEVIDGQQRLSSFVLLAAAVAHFMRSISGSIKLGSRSEQDEMAFNYLEKTALAIESNYLRYSYPVKLMYQNDPKIRLSKADDKFFQSTLDGKDPDRERSSHVKIKNAWIQIKAFLEKELEAEITASGKATILQHLIDGVLAEDCTVIFMWADNRSEAYQIFEVLNNRGVSLTDSNLLRAKTLGLLDDRKLLEIQKELSERWDSVLAYASRDIDDYLKWYFASHEGYRPGKFEVTEKFMSCRFQEQSISRPITEEQGRRVLAEVEQIDDDFALLYQLKKGKWPYSEDSSVAKWDIGRLAFLVEHLSHTNVMPLLMALRLLTPERFAEAVASLERFVFRYKTIGSAHISPATKVYHEHAKIIRSQPSAYSVGKLRGALKELIEKYASGKRFSLAISELAYAPRSSRRNNSNIRYFLVAIEDYHLWYDNGAQGMPICKDKSKIIDMADVSLEHIYPQNLGYGNQIEEIEPIKNSLGNLTLLGVKENDKIGNKPFDEKRQLYEKSSLRINRNIARNEKWTKLEIEMRTAQLAKIAEKIFIP